MSIIIYLFITEFQKCKNNFFMCLSLAEMYLASSWTFRPYLKTAPFLTAFTIRLSPVFLFSVCMKTINVFLLSDTQTAQRDENIKNASNGNNSKKHKKNCVKVKIKIIKTQISLKHYTKSMFLLFLPTGITTVGSSGNSDAFNGSRNVTERTMTEGNTVLYLFLG